MLLPSNNTVIFFATAPMIVPTVNNTNIAKMVGFLPKASEIEKIVGCNTHEVSKNDVPSQKVSSAVPLRS
jgi:hypothetical protein